MSRNYFNWLCCHKVTPDSGIEEVIYLFIWCIHCNFALELYLIDVLAQLGGFVTLPCRLKWMMSPSFDVDSTPPLIPSREGSRSTQHRILFGENSSAGGSSGDEFQLRLRSFSHRHSEYSIWVRVLHNIATQFLVNRECEQHSLLKFYIYVYFLICIFRGASIRDRGVGPLNSDSTYCHEEDIR